MGFSGFEKTNGSKAYIDPDYIVRVDEHGEDQADIYTADGQVVRVNESAISVMNRIHASQPDDTDDDIQF